MNDRKKQLEHLLGERFFQETKNKTRPSQAQLKSLFSEVSSYFYKLYGELWLSSLDDHVESFWRLHLVGLSMEQIADGIELMNKNGKSHYPPNALEFRGYCLGYGAKHSGRATPTENALKIIV